MVGGTQTLDPGAVSTAFLKYVGIVGFSESPKPETGFSPTLLSVRALGNFSGKFNQG